MCVYMYVCVADGLPICEHVFVYVCVYVCMYVCVANGDPYVGMYSRCSNLSSDWRTKHLLRLCMYVHMYVCAYVCMCVCMYALLMETYMW
jgi:hypothetical protein